MALLLAVMGGSSAVLGLGLGIGSVYLIMVNINSRGGFEAWAFIAFPLAIIALIFSGLLLLFGLLGIREAFRQLASEPKIS